MKCKVFLVGEGPDDIGDLANPPTYREGREGFLQPLLRSMVGEQVELEIDGHKLMHLPKEPRARVRAGARQAENAARALALASQHGAAALVLSFDTDKTSGERAKPAERRKLIRALRESTEDGFAHARANDEAAAAIHTAIAAPSRMIEAWALGDRAALAGLVGVPERDLQYGNPEDLWGKEQDAESDHPKCVWRRLTEGRVEFSEIGAAADPSTLAKTCPDSFQPFADDVDQALRNCTAAGAVKRRRRRGSTDGPPR